MHHPPALILYSVRAAAERLPADSPLSAIVESAGLDLDDVHVLWVDGDLQLPQLDGDAPCEQVFAAAGRVQPDDLVFVALVVAGSLVLSGPLAALDEGDGDTEPCHVVVLGDLRASALLPAETLLYVGDHLQVQSLVWCNGADHLLHVHGDLRAQVALLTDDCGAQIDGQQEVSWTFTNDGPHGADALAFVLEPGMFDAFDDGRGGFSWMLERGALVDAARAGRPLLQPLDQIVALVPVSRGHASPAAAQVLAQAPLRAQLMREMTPQRIADLAALPLMRDCYNAWEGGERMGLWLGELFVALRQPQPQGAEHGSAALKLAWRTDGDDAQNHRTFLMQAGPDGALHIAHVQREDDAWEELAPQDVQHHARLLRYWRALVPRLHTLNAEHEAQIAEARRVAQLAQLLREPPYADNLPDDAIFAAEVIQVSQQWRAEGAAWIATVRDYQRRAAAGELSEEEKSADLAVDPRLPQGPLVLQLAREVHRREDAGLQARFHRMFPFAPDALAEVFAQEEGQPIGPVFWLGPAMAVAAIGPEGDEARHWVVIDDDSSVNLKRLPELHGLGRSMDRRCWARSDGRHVITAQRWNGGKIARFDLPDGTEDLPPEWDLRASPVARRCDELIPFNDGQRVLLRNPTGVYVLRARGQRIERLHPRGIDASEDGAYTWAKNRNAEGDALELSMLHMALSPCERYVALGDQDSLHILLELQSGAVLGEVDPLASYPHHAAFTPDGSAVLFNSCHLYNGITQRMELAHPDAEPQALDWNWRLYASTPVAGELSVAGCAHGYLHALENSGAQRWKHYIGSSMSGMDAAPEGDELLAASHGGYLVRLVRRTDGASDPYSLGDSPYDEVGRWLFPKEGQPLRW